MVLKDVHDTLEEIPEQYRDLYTEKNGKFECTGITGLRTSGDFTRISKALEDEKALHKATKADLSGKLQEWETLGSIDDTRKKVERFPELEAAAGNKLDEAKIEEIVQRRVDGTIKSRTAPLEHQVATLKRERDELKVSNEQWVGKDRSRTIREHLRKAAIEKKVRPEAMDDVLDLGERVHELTDDGRVVTRDGVGITPGLEPVGWLDEVSEKRSYWWPDSQGGGAGGSGRGGSAGGGKNPWSRDHWNVTEQARVFKQHGRERAEALAKAAGSSIGATQPPPAKKAS